MQLSRTALSRTCTMSCKQAGTILIAAEFGMVLRSRDGARPGLFRITTTHLFSPCTRGEWSLGRVGQAGYIISSKDDGVSWQASKSGTNANLLGVSSSAKLLLSWAFAQSAKRKWWPELEGCFNPDTERRWYQGIAGVSPDSDGRKFVAAGQFGQIVNF